MIATVRFTGVDGQLKGTQGTSAEEGDYTSRKADGKEVDGAAFKRGRSRKQRRRDGVTILREDQEFDLKVKPEETRTDSISWYMDPIMARE